MASRSAVGRARSHGLAAFTAVVALVCVTTAPVEAAPAPASRTGRPAAPPPWARIARSPLSPALTLAETASRGAAGSRSSAVTPAPGTPMNAQASWGGYPLNSTPVSVDPANPSYLLSAAVDANCTTFAATYVSHDGGQTWSGSCMGLPPGWWWGCSLPMVGWNAAGLAYRADVVSPGTFCTSSPGGAQTSVAFDVSHDGGASWTALSTLPSLHPYGLIDMPELAVDTAVGSPRTGAMYVSATQFDTRGLTTSISVSHSTDGGTTWTTVPVATPLPASTVDQFSDVTTAPDGTVTVSWMQCQETSAAANCAGAPATLESSSSSDGGTTWSGAATIATVSLPPDACTCAFYGNLPNTSEWLAEIPALAAGGGGLTAVFDTWNGTDLQVESSLQSGGAWSPPQPVAAAATDEFMPWVAASDTGSIGVTWLDRRDDPADVSYRAYSATSAHGSAFGAPEPLGSVLSNPFNDGYGGGYLGTRSGAAWAGGSLYASWPDTREVSSQDEVGTSGQLPPRGAPLPAAGTAPWTSSGPMGFGAVQAVAADPNDPDVVYAADGPAGVFRSEDGGAHWRATGPGMAPNLIFHQLAVDPADPSTVYVASDGGGVYATDDGGATWHQSSEGMQSAFARSVVVAPTNPEVLYAAMDSYGEPQGVVGMYRSDDGGAHWHHAGGGLPANFPFLAIAVDPRSADTAWAVGGMGQGGLAVWRTTDGGASWASSTSGLPGSGAAYAVTADPVHPGVVYVGLTSSTGSAPAGVYRSTDGGLTWSTGSATWPGAANNVFSVVSDGSTVYAGTTSGVVVSTDGCATWSALPAGPGGVVSSLTAAGTRLYATSAFYGLGGVYRSDDGGSGWTRRSAGLPGDTIAAVTSSGDGLFAAQGGVVFRSTDEGATWTPTGGQVTADAGITSLAVTPAGVLFAGVGSSGSPGVYRSDDLGATWTPEPASPAAVSSLLASTAQPGTLWAGADGGVWDTSDGGTTWTAATGFPPAGGYTVSTIVADPASPALLYAGTMPASTSGNAIGVLKSVDGGATWAPLPGGLATPDVESLAVAPSSTSTLYAGLYGGGVETSSDGGGTWTPTSLGSGVIAALAVDPADPSHVWAGTPDGGDIYGEPTGGVFESHDGGTTWTQIGPFGEGVNALLLDSAGVLHAATSGGVFELAVSPAAMVPEWPSGPPAVLGALAVALALRRRGQRRRARAVVTDRRSSITA